MPRMFYLSRYISVEIVLVVKYNTYDYVSIMQMNPIDIIYNVFNYNT